MYNKHGLTWVFGIGLLLAPGCDDGDDGSGDDAGDGDGDGTGEGDGDGDKDPTGDGDGDGDTNGDFADTDDELEGCALNETEADCMAEAGCATVFGKALADDGNGGWCTTTPEEFIGCASSSDLCPSLSKTLCDGESYWRTTACVPDNLDVCEAPGEITGDC
jgi:hypothetical protein